MANFALSTASAVERWSAAYTAEYIRASALLPYMGTDETSIIRVRNELTNQAGAAIHFPLIQRLRGAGVTGGTVLFGSEDTLNNYSDCVRTGHIRNAVAVSEDQTFKTDIDIMNAARSSLRNWSAETLRNDILAQLQSVIVKNGAANAAEDTSVIFGSATAAQRDVYLTNNADRILFGSAAANLSTTSPQGGATYSWANSALNVTAGMTLSAAMLRRLKTMAKKAGSAAGTAHIAPFKSDMTEGREFYVLFVGTEGFRDLSLDTSIIAANTNARAREGMGMDKNPLFQDGDLLYQGVIIREIPELTNLGTVGASSAVLSQAFLCGQSAVALAYSRKPNPRIQDWDYGHQHNVAISEIRGQKKTSFNGVTYGVVTSVHAAAVDN